MGKRKVCGFMIVFTLLFTQLIFAQMIVSEDFETGFTLDTAIGNHADWFDENGTGPVITAGIGVAGSNGLAPGDAICTWTAHPFDWTDPDVCGIIVEMDFQTDASSAFDDDRIGWMISDVSKSSSNIFGLQLDPGGSGFAIEGYWDGVTEDDKRPLIADLPVLNANSWHRFRAEIMKLTDGSAKIFVMLTELDGDGNPFDVVGTGYVEDTSLLGDDAPNAKYFAGPIWPAYKNYDGIEGAADNASFEIVIISNSFFESFDIGFADGVTLNEHADWFSDDASPITADAGIDGTPGVAANDNIIVWTAHPFDWTDPDFQKITVEIDVQTDAAGQFDDDRVGWFISDTDIGSSNIMGLQCDPGGSGASGLNIEGYWDGLSADDKRPSIVDLPELYPDTWYRFRGELTKISDYSASIFTMLTELAEDGTPVEVVATGFVPDTDDLGDDTPGEKYFDGPIWPAYKNYDGITGGADNVSARINTEVATSVDPVIETLPTECALLQNYPNPFNPETTIYFDLEKSAHVKLSVFNSLGQTVAVLMDQTQQNGHHSVQWDGTNLAGLQVESGIYIYQLQTGNHIESRKMLLVK